MADWMKHTNRMHVCMYVRMLHACLCATQYLRKDKRTSFQQYRCVYTTSYACVYTTKWNRFTTLLTPLHRHRKGYRYRDRDRDTRRHIERGIKRERQREENYFTGRTPWAEKNELKKWYWYVRNFNKQGTTSHQQHDAKWTYWMVISFNKKRTRSQQQKKKNQSLAHKLTHSINSLSHILNFFITPRLAHFSQSVTHALDSVAPTLNHFINSPTPSPHPLHHLTHALNHLLTHLTHPFITHRLSHFSQSVSQSVTNSSTQSLTDSLTSHITQALMHITYRVPDGRHLSLLVDEHRAALNLIPRLRSPVGLDQWPAREGFLVCTIGWVPPCSRVKKTYLYIQTNADAHARKLCRYTVVSRQSTFLSSWGFKNAHCKYSSTTTAATTTTTTTTTLH